MDALLLLLAAVAGFAFSLFSYRFPVAGLSVGLLLYAAPILRVGSEADLRLGILPVVLGFALRIGRDGFNGTAIKRNSWLIAALIVVFASYLMSFLWTYDVSKSVQSLAAMAITMVLIIVAGAALRPAQILRAVYVAMAIVVVFSILQGVIGVSGALESGRLRGLTGNANSLAVTSLILAAAAIPMRRRFVQVLGLLAALLAAMWAGSRAGTAAIVLLIIVVFLLQTKSWIGRTLSLLGAGIIVLLAVNDDWMLTLNQSDAILFRTNDSRSDYLQLAWQQIEQTWPWGLGVGGSSSSGEAGVNVVFKLASEIGILSIPVFIIFFGLMMKHSTQSVLTLGIFTVCLANNMFEGWMLTFGNVYTVALFLLLSNVHLLTKENPNSLSEEDDYRRISIERRDRRTRPRKVRQNCG